MNHEEKNAKKAHRMRQAEALEGYKVVGYRKPLEGELYMESNGAPAVADFYFKYCECPILEAEADAELYRVEVAFRV